MAHIGFTPQSEHALGGYRVQGRGDAAARVLAEAQAIEAAGAFAVVMEMVPGDVAAQVTASVGIPTIGIGAGNDCDGQVLVWQDAFGLRTGRMARFVKQYADVHGVLLDGRPGVRRRREGRHLPRPRAHLLTCHFLLPTRRRPVSSCCPPGTDPSVRCCPPGTDLVSCSVAARHPAPTRQVMWPRATALSNPPAPDWPSRRRVARVRRESSPFRQRRARPRRPLGTERSTSCPRAGSPRRAAGSCA